MQGLSPSPHIGIIGLGYVGLPLAVAFGRLFPTIGYDTNQARLDELNAKQDSTREVPSDQLAAATHLNFTHDLTVLKPCNVYIVTVPTPLDAKKQPDLTALKQASQTVASILTKNNIVIYESTVYPGATEEICVPLLEKGSGLTFNKDFFVGYSPERINPGDTKHRLADIVKVTSGSTVETADYIDKLYQQITKVGTHKASSIRVAEAAKVIENTQRDLNIALINELAIIFNKLNIDTEEVLQAAGSKWNFLPFKPGLVGGHCIGVDPYYLTHKAQAIGYKPDVILAGRKINDSMADYVAEQVIALMVKKKIVLNQANVLIMGLAFKENCPDVRNSQVANMLPLFIQQGISVEVYDPCVDPILAEKEYGIKLVDKDKLHKYDAVVIAVAHDVFKEQDIKHIKKLLKNNGIIYDVKHCFVAIDVDGRL